MLFKSVVLLRYSEPVISSGVRAIEEVKDLKERVTLLQDEKLALEKAKQAEVEELRGQVWSKDHQLEESKVRISELKKAFAELFEATSKLKAEVKYIEEQ